MRLKMACLPPTVTMHSAGRVVGAVVVAMALADSLLQFKDPAGRRVLGEVGIDGCDGGALDVVRRREIGLAGSEIDHVDSFAAKAVGFGRDFHGGRLADPRNPLG